MDCALYKGKPAIVGRSAKTIGIHTMNNNTTITLDLAKEVLQVAVFTKFGKARRMQCQK
jgi:hypothetical protein